MATPFEGWAVLELLGHRSRPGFVCEVEMAGTKMLRVDIPISKDDAGQDVILTEYYSGGAVYSLRPCTEEVAREQMRWMSDPRPVRPMDFRESTRLTRQATPEDDGPTIVEDVEDEAAF